MGSSTVPLFNGNESLTSFVNRQSESKMLSILTQATLPSLLRFSSKFFAFWKIGVLNTSAKCSVRILAKKESYYSKDFHCQES